MSCRACVLIMRAVVGWAPPAWLRPTPRSPASDMAVARTSDLDDKRAFRESNPSYGSRKAELEAEQLQRDVKRALKENTAAVDESARQVEGIKNFEARARDTLRDLMVDMARDDVPRD